MCARLSWTHSAFESMLNYSIVSYRIVTRFALAELHKWETRNVTFERRFLLVSFPQKKSLSIRQDNANHRQMSAAINQETSG